MKPITETTICPWCEEQVFPIPNDGTGQSFTGQKNRMGRDAWVLRNPAMCPKCGGVGCYEDFGVGAGG